MATSNPTQTPPLRQRLQARARRARALLAYTVIEVMMAMSVLAIGATGVIAMQKAALLGNVRARDLATATTLASSWLERLRIDGLMWQQNPNGLSTLPATTWLNVVTTANAGTWVVPNAAFNYQNGADLHGYDVTVASGQQGFCVNMRLTQLLPTIIRAEVRVYWLRTHNQARSGGGSGMFQSGNSLCANSAALLQDLSTDEALQRYHFVYMTSAISRNDAP